MSARDNIAAHFTSDTLANQLLDAFRAESIAEFETYPGELAMLRGLLGVIRVVAKHGDMDEVRRLLAEHASDEQAAIAGGRLVSATDRLALLRRAIRDYEGEWTTRMVQRLYRARGYDAPLRKTARDDLALLHRQGLLVCDDTDPGRRRYRLNHAHGGAR